MEETNVFAKDQNVVATNVVKEEHQNVAEYYII